MSGSERCDSVSLTRSELQGRRRTTFFVIVLLPVVIAAVLFRLDPFEPVLLPAHEISRPNLVAGTLARNDNMRRGSEVVGNGRVAGPEDLVYDVATNVVYTGCRDGWIKRVKLSDDSVSGSEVVEDWVNTGGRPLGVALDHGGALIVGDANKGLLRITKDKKVEVLTDEVDGLKFKLTDGVDVAKDGTIYFTDASYKYSLKDHFLDLLEGKPHGRFMSYDPTTKKTKVLLHNLYFPNGVAVSPDQQFVIFCESVLMKCKKYYIEGPKKGSVEKFCDNLPGYPDNIHYDEQGQYWIGLGSGSTSELDIIFKYPLIRKALGMFAKYVVNPNIAKNGGVISVDLDGKPIGHYSDPKLALASGIKIGDHIYCGSLSYPFILRLDVKQYPAISSSSSKK
ncbi:protein STRICTOSIDINE SYNTHASE-LIKE 7-like isoform X1 [Arachis stenosperma]|uniref:protein STRICTOSIDINE SYNTHASE-LIKE 7-like isoform X1 n=1 Tax=Arachis stenosperma TaxID=217475 RepID=UPI0025ABD406|nr:protein STRICTOSIDINE SYNTHASE-LIKE 7-like isoform X1 [Arachis stenosperma]